MKQGKRPTVRQRKFMQQLHLNAKDWLVSQDTPSVMVIIHRHTGASRRIEKDGVMVG